MYRCIWVSEEQRNLQAILWRSSPNDSLREYCLNTVTYGTSSAPYLAIRCLKQLGIENEGVNPEAAEIIKIDFYVDDLLTGADNVADILSISKSVSSILATAGFNLRKWASNSKDILNEFESRDSNLPITNLSNFLRIILVPQYLQYFTI